MEQQFSALEQEAALITKGWLYHLNPGCYIHIPKVNRKIMSLYITTQLLRTSEARDILVQGIASQMTVPIDKEIERELHIELLWNDEIVARISDWVHDCTWIFRSNTMTDSLYTSDDPIKVRSKTQHLHWAQTSSPGAYLLMPLTSKILMYCFDSRDWSGLKPLDRQLIPKPLEPKLVRDANVHQVGHARRFVFSD